MTKALVLVVPLGGLLVACTLLPGPGAYISRADLIIAMAMLLLYGSELGGLASNMRSDLDPLLARLGVGAVGNIALAGTIRTELLNGYRELTHDRDRCVGCGQCYAVCPQGAWEMSDEGKAAWAHREACTACQACLVQCVSGAIQALQVGRYSKTR